MKYYEAFGEAGYHTAFFTTYAFSKDAFEDIILPRIRSAGCRHVHVLADTNMVNSEFSEFGTPKYAGSLYHLLKVKPPAGCAFHPKMVLQLGLKKARLLIGSANLTAPGLAGNREIITELTCTESDTATAPILLYALDYIRRWARGDSLFEQGVHLALKSTPILNSSESKSMLRLDEAGSVLALVSDSEDSDVLSQFVSACAGDQIKRLIILSPYWDSRLKGLKDLTKRLGVSRCSILIDESRHEFPAMSLGNFDVDFYSLAALPEKRFTHAKFILAEGENCDHFLSGSVNCSWPALTGITFRSGNAEAGFYRELQHGQSLLELGLQSCFDRKLSKEDLKQGDLSRSEDNPSYSADGGRLISRASGVEYEFEDLDARPIAIKLFDQTGGLLEECALNTSSATRIRLRVAADLQKVAFGRASFGLNDESAPIIIEKVEELQRSTIFHLTSPQRRAVETLRSIDDEDLTILECWRALSEIADQTTHQESVLRVKVSASHSECVDKKEFPTLSYADFSKIQPELGAMKTPSLVAGTPMEEVPRALDRLLGMMSAYGNEEAEARLQDEDIDLSASELSTESLEEDQLQQEVTSDYCSFNSDEPAEAPFQRRRRNREMAGKLFEIVKSLEQRLVAVRETNVSVNDLILIRLVLQLICAFGSPVGDAISDERPLPCWSSDARGWPRLIGRVISGILRIANNPFGTLEIPKTFEQEPEELVAVWGASIWCMRASIQAAQKTPNAASLLPRLQKLEQKLIVTVKATTSDPLDSASAIEQFAITWAQRFSTRLNLS
jgi:hypothetical protein